MREEIEVIHVSDDDSRRELIAMGYRLESRDSEAKTECWAKPVSTDAGAPKARSKSRRARSAQGS